MLGKEKLDRINTLARKAKKEGLNREEKKEQQRLRNEYLAVFRESFKKQLQAVTVVDPEGNDVTPAAIRNNSSRFHS